ncbi:MAG: excinuclease ABC subunit A, partial [Opitutales bacterium]|nr:excinuclease ABC subunit A [Opitutales bacterium]
MALLQKSYKQTNSDGFRARLMTYQTDQECSSCQGHRFSQRSANVFVEGKSVPDFLAMDLGQAYEFAASLPASEDRVSTYGEVVEGIELRLRFLREVGLCYLTLDRQYSTLSGGEAQRVRLATQLGMSLVGVVYVLDEPSIGLHPRDNRKLIQSLKELRDRGNSVIVVEHDEEMMRASDHLIELGPGAGSAGGKMLFEGPPEECGKETSGGFETGDYLSGKRSLAKAVDTKAPQEDWITIKQASEHNLRDVDAHFPIGLLTCVTGVSGSGKSTLVNEILAKAAARKLNRSRNIPGSHKGIDGLEKLERVVRVSQDPIGQSPRSNPATY